MQIAVQAMSNYEDTLRLARWCEEHGVAALAVADHFLSGASLDSAALDQLVLLGGIARETSTIQLATLVSPLTFRHPAVQLKAAVTLDAMSHGRFSLGVGTGWMQEEHDAFGLDLYPMAERFDRLEENLVYLRSAIADGAKGFRGRYYKLQEFDPQPRPGNLRLIVGGIGSRRTPELAGRYADEFNLAAGEHPWETRVTAARDAARAAGRDANSLHLSVAFPPVAADNEAGYREALAERAAARGLETDQLEETLQKFHVPVGPPDRLVKGLTALDRIGIERIYLQMGDDVDAAMRQAALFMEAASSVSTQAGRTNGL